jgi:putative salt-induced outer membrane protein YdiY
VRIVDTAFFVLTLCIAGSADQISLKNGDRLTGSVVKADAKELVLQTEFAGRISVLWDAIAVVDSPKPLHLELQSGRTVSGPVKMYGEAFEVTTRAGEIQVSKAEVTAIRNDEEQQAYQRSFDPPFSANWVGGVNIGFALTRGNSQSKNFALGFNADRETRNDKLSLYANSVYSTNDAPGAIPSTTANAILGGLRYDRNLTPRIFGFANADFMTDDLQSLDIRQTYGGGLGYHAIKREDMTLDLLGGMNYTREEYTTFTRDFPAGTFGEEFDYKFSPSMEFTQKAFYYPDFSSAGDYRATANAGLVTKVNRWLGWQLNFGDIYVTNPPLGKKNNDLIFTTGLNVSLFGGKEEKCPCK